MTLLRSLKKRRATIKSNVTKLLNYIRNINDDTRVEDIKARLSHIEKLRDEFNQTEDKIVELDEKEELDPDFEENYYTAVASLNHALWARNLEPSVNMNDIVFGNTSASGNHAEVKLPKIAIPLFSGDYTEWQSFFDLFCSTIHNNHKLTASQKLQYLKGSLKGEAAGLLKHFNITDANYIEALKKLKERYDRRKHTIYAFIRNFMSQPPVNAPNSTNVRRLLDTSDEVIRGLKALGEDAESRDHWLIHILISKLDEETNSLWARDSADINFPTLKQFFEFLVKRIDALESLKTANKRPQLQWNQQKQSIKGHAAAIYEAPLCTICPEEKHKLFDCDKFKEMSLEKRKELLKEENRCFNCLNNNHGVYNCKSRFRCRHCNRKHNSLVHEDIPVTTSIESTSVVLNAQTNHPDPTINNNDTIVGTSLLPTALVHVLDSTNQKQLCRALLDSGSQGSFITESCVQRLKLKRRNAKFAITGIGAATNGYTRGSVSLAVSPWNKNKPCFQIEAFILSKLTAKQGPTSEFSDNKLLQKYELADPYFYKGGEIDIIIGVDTFFEILTEGKIVTNNNLIMQNTLLGWIVVDKSNKAQPRQSITVSLSDPENNIENLLRKFWEIEAVVDPQNKLSQEEEFCERHFEATKKTDSSGRFELHLPFKLSPSMLGDSFSTAGQRMHSVERRFIRDKEFASQYKDFMSEYISLGHMKEVTDKEASLKGYFLPHHGVIKSSSSTTKLRVVFDGSAKSTTGVSLNDCLAVGPTVQSNLYDILIRFRLFKISFTADIEKMFRQVRVAENDTKYQRIVWRESPNKPFTTYQLQTVTYGTASATYLATRALNEATEKWKNIFPDAVNHIKNNIYVDDLMTGCDSIEDAIKLGNKIDSILSSSGFNLRKWLSNDETLLNNLTRPANQMAVLEIEDSNTVKVLGLHWNPKNDCFKFKVSLNPQPVTTKRQILSEASRLFDPFGWLAPVTVKVKIFFQTLWLKNLGWDDPLANDLATEWLKLRDNLVNIEKIEISRYIGTTSDTKLKLHGFSDASKNAYAAVVYIEVTKPNREPIVRLLTAKTKVAPVKQISIPRLELCGALLLSKLLVTVKQALKTKISEINAWTDSTIVLDWLSTHPTKWNTFVGNRTGEILTEMNRSQWRHVSSQDNPADYASRGVDPEKLQEIDLWWNGPTWLTNVNNWPKDVRSQCTTNEEIRNQVTHVQIPPLNIIDTLAENISNFSKIVRILAYALRFIHTTSKSNQQPKLSTTQLLTAELRKSQLYIFHYLQSKHFQLEIKCIASNKDLPTSSSLKYLKPFLDESGLLRVGGRIKNAALTYDIKHPLILTAKDQLVERIVKEHHLRYLHAGHTLMMATLRHKYWIIGCRNLIRKIIQSCVKCTKYSARELNQMMGDLPNPRVTLVRPFYKVGVDYAGPIQTHAVRGRGQKTFKSYICIFVCLATKAVHIELVSDLTTDAYLAALRRFVARRGVCSEIQSDNGTNFIGARNHLHDFYSFLKQNFNSFSKFLLTDEIQFKFIPPNSPHFGGLWEAAVRSIKFHLRRVTDGHILTIEEMTTLLAEIEAMLNSRPICVLSSDDLDYLTPAHFLIGRPTTQLPSEDLVDAKISKLSRWQMLQKMNQHIWRRWHLEYLTNLQHRNKWHTKEDNIKINDIVLVKENNIPPSKWLLAKVTELHPGADGNVRVVTLKTQQGQLKRPIHKLCKLPVS